MINGRRAWASFEAGFRIRTESHETFIDLRNRTWRQGRNVDVPPTIVDNAGDSRHADRYESEVPLDRAVGASPADWPKEQHQMPGGTSRIHGSEGDSVPFVPGRESVEVLPLRPSIMSASMIHGHLRTAITNTSLCMRPRAPTHRALQFRPKDR